MTTKTHHLQSPLQYWILNSCMFFALLLLQSNSFASQENLILLDNQKSEIMMAGKYLWLEDETAELDITDVSEAEFLDKFKLSLKDNLSFGYTNSAAWLRIDIQKSSDDSRPWLLSFDYPLLDKIEIYQQANDGSWSMLLMGDKLPFGERPIQHRSFVTTLQLKNAGINTIFVRITSSSSLVIRPGLQTAHYFFNQRNQLQLLFGIIYGFMIMMALYNIFIFVAVKDLTYLVYVTSVVSATIFVMSLSGHSYQFLWPNSPSLANTILPLTSASWLVASALFAQLFLETKHYAPVFHKVINGMVMLGCIGILLSLFADYQTAIRYSTAMVMINGILIFTTGAVSWYRGNKAARFFTLAWVIYGFGTGTLVLSRFGVLPDNFVTHHSIIIGILVEILVLSLALSDKYRALSKQLADYTTNLEQKIDERTIELKQANQALKQLSLIDPVTVLPNRREFDFVLNKEWKRHMRSQKSLGLLFCDIDQFKMLNDQYGHDRGDECLRQFAEVIKKSLHRAADHPSRIGGDEFAVVLPETHLHGATILANEICENLRKLKMEHATDAENDIVTTSIGVAVLIPEQSQQSIELFRSADQALYKAKKQGRNQAAVSDDTSPDLLSSKVDL